MSRFKPSSSSIVRPRPARRGADTQIEANLSPARSVFEAESELGTGGPIEEPIPNAIQRIGYVTTLLFVFFRFSFAHEFVAAKFNFNTHIIILLGGISYLCCILSGRMAKALSEKTTLLWCGFLVFMCAATATSFWKGGSFPILIEYLETVFPVVFLIPAMTTTRKQFVLMVGTMGLACMTTIGLGMLNNDFKSGRMNIDAAGSDIQDPNDYAAHLILMLPALAFFTLRAGRPIVLKLAGIATFGLSFRQILSTGSRGGLLSLSITALYIAAIGSKKVKVGILIGAPIVVLMALPFVPSESTSRLSLLFSSTASAAAEEAVDSKEARIALLEESGKITLQHPLFGVGPGIFADYQAVKAGEIGQRGMWHATHNSYTQISSECGIPAFLLYIGALVNTLLLLRSVARSKDRELAAVALIVSVMIVGFCICMFFLSLAYNVQILVLSALAVAMKQRVEADGNVVSSANAAGLPATAAVTA